MAYHVIKVEMISEKIRKTKIACIINEQNGERACSENDIIFINKDINHTLGEHLLNESFTEPESGNAILCIDIIGIEIILFNTVLFV